jgi:hypothetical protein
MSVAIVCMVNNTALKASKSLEEPLLNNTFLVTYNSIYLPDDSPCQLAASSGGKSFVINLFY